MQEHKASDASQKPWPVNFNQRVEQSLARLKDEGARTTFQIAIATFDQDKGKTAQQNFDALPEPEKAKEGVDVLDLPHQLAFASALAVSFGFNRMPSARILGIGRRAAHLLYCAKALGHRVTVASPSYPSHDQLLKLYGLEHFVQARTSKMPDGRFDAIVSTNLSHASAVSWAAFFRPLAAAMTDDAQIYLTIVRRPLPERNFDPETVLAMFERLGAEVSRRNFSIILTAEQAKALIESARPADKADPASDRPEQVEPASDLFEEMASTEPDIQHTYRNRDRRKTVAIAVVIVLLVIAGLAVWLLK